MKIVKILTAFMFSLVVSVAFGAGGAMVGLNPVITGISAGVLSFIPTPVGMVSMKIGTLTTGAAVNTVIDLQYVPEKIFYVAATQLTALKIEVLGEGVIVDLDSNGLTYQGKHRVLGPVTNGYMIDVADGIITGKSCRLTFTNSAAQTPDIYALGDNAGSIYIRTLKATVLLNNNTPLDKFAALFMPSFAAGDKATVTYDDGTTQIWELADMQAYSGLYQNAPLCQIDNLESEIVSVQLLVAATQTVFVTDYKQA